MSSTRSALHGNPFALLLDPSAVLAACKTSKPLSALHNAVYKPLDKPRLSLDTSAAEFDTAIDSGLPASLALPSLPAEPAAATVAPKKSAAKRRGSVLARANTAYEAEPADAGELVLIGRTR